ncbi:MAG: UvrD-helicase domain-containing protein [Eubacteriales bacterium]|nr:UvrD-helicase domain-containing protein [Eubacteriales bacterium]
MSIYDSLNREQQRACFQTEGPVLILAGAGSGKTRVITHRICYLIDECSVNPWNILAITFTNKAAGEMRERVDKLVGFGAESIWISTFHSMCVRILRRHIDQLGYETSFTIYDTDDQKTLMREVCHKLRIDTKSLKEKTILNAISSAKNELYTPRLYRENNVMDFTNRQIADAYEEYQRALHRNNALDFDDLLMKTVELFRSHEEILDNYQERFRYIMVDEYQDTNTAQFELIRLLAGRYRNLCVVGDDDQSIYKFRGANINNILDFEKVYPDALTVKLEQNYRSTQNVLNAANAVIRNNTKRKAKALWSDHGEGHKIHFRQFNTAAEEAAFIAEDIEDWLRRDRKLSYRDFALLYRTNAQARMLEERLVMEGIPYNIVGGTNFYARREIKDMLSYLKTIDNGRDDLAVQRIINVPRRGIGRTTIERIAEYAAAQGIGFFEAMERADQIETIGKAAAKLSPFVEMIHGLRSFAEENSIEDLMKEVIEVTGYQRDLEESDEDDVQDRIANIDELISKIVAYEEQAQEEEPTLSGFLEEVALVADIDSVEEDDDRVVLMTIHSSKGLEFSHVYLAGMEDGVFPGFMTIETGDYEAMEEERRLAYVAITRAKEELTITCARARMVRGETQYNPVSRFVMEIPENLLDGKPSYGGRRRRDDDDDLPFADEDGAFGRKSYDRKYEGFGGGAGGRGRYGDDYGAEARPAYRGGSYQYGAGYGSGSGTSGGGTGRSSAAPGRAGDGRLKAVYVKPHTPQEHKPAIAKMGGAGSLSGLRKGMPQAGEKPSYDVGDRVQHIKYGEGVVKAMEKGPRDYKVTVEFDGAGQKIMYAAFAKLQKV